MGVSPKWSRALGKSNSSGTTVGVAELGQSRQQQQQQQEQQQQRQQQQQQGEEEEEPLRGCCSSSGVAAVAAEQPHWWLDVEASALAAATTSVAVMAPALTEGGPQKPENLLPALPAGGFLTAGQAKQVCQNREVLQFVVSANVQPSKIDEQCLHGIPKDLIDDVINLKFASGFDGLSDLIAAGAPRKESAAVAREAAANGGGAAIMNNPSVGDDEPVDSMCFYRTDMGPSGEDELCEIDDIARDAASAAQVADAEDNVPAAAAAAAVNDNAVTDEDSQIAEDIMGFTDINNVQADDLLQGIIQLNNVSSQEMLSGDSRLIDGCGGLIENVIPSQSTSDGVPEIFSDNDAFSLLNEVDVMGLMGNDNIADNGVIVDQHHNQQQQILLQQHQLIQQEAAKLAELERHKAQVERRHHEIERRSAFLTRRLRKFQAQLVGLHAAEEAGQVLELAQKSAKKFLHQELASLQRGGNNARNFPEIVGSVTSFLQKVQKSCTAQSNSVAVRNKNSCRYFGAGSRDNYVNSNANRTPGFGVPQIRIDGKQLEQVAGPLSTKLKILQNAYDSDCTASSSGGESCDEMQTFNNPHKQQLPISKRASWRWAQDRASVAARWTWLQAQISDLEFRIRQHTDLQRQMRSTKGLVMLEVPATTITAAAAAAAAAAATAATTSPSAPLLPYGPESTLNGYSGVLAAAASSSSRTCGLEAGVEPAAANLGSSRCRPYVRHMFRKRKLVQLEGLHLYSKKAARASSLRCDCDGRLAYCALCTGRRDPTAGQDMELMSVQERLALVDPGFHSVLSMPDEVSLAAHADAILRIPEWQQRMVRGGVRMTKMKDKDGTERRNRRPSEHRSKCPSRLKKSQTALISSSIKRKLLKGKRSRNNSERPNNSSVNRKRPPKQTQQQQQQQQQQHQQQQHQLQQSQPQLQLQQLQPSQQQQQSQQTTLPMDEEEEVASALSSSSKYSSPVPSPLLQHSGGSASAVTTPTASVTPAAEKSALKSSNSHSYSRLRQNSYDIDNIVIPYSIAAATRLEKLPYKDIVIPKWRICTVPPLVDVKNGAMQKSLPDSDVEDISENTIAQRHDRSERDEAKRFMNFAHLPYQSRMRRDRRMEGRSESGANTPDPMSPHASDCGGDTMSPITSPPPTPGNVHDSEHMDSHNRSSLQNALRRKMSTRSQKEETTCSFTEEEQELILPYEPRNFPLTDEDYSEMRKEMPYEHPLESSSTPDCQQNENKDEAEIYSQESDSTESALCDMEGDDPNDPEWSIEEREKERERMRPR